jgi:hypothetical protein
MDLVYIALGILFFVVAWAYVIACDRLGGKAS